MTSTPPDQPGAAPTGWDDQFGAAPAPPAAPAPDFGTDPYGRPAGTDPSAGGAGAAAGAGTGTGYDQGVPGQAGGWDQQPAPGGTPGAWQQPGAGAPAWQQQPQYPQAAWGGGMSGATCVSCGNPVGATVHCINCNQMVGMAPGYLLATAGERFLQALLEGVLALVTLVIGYLIWSIFFTWKEGQTPAMKLMHLRCIRKVERTVATRGTMAMRQILGGIVQSALNYIIVGVILYFMIFWDKDRQLVWDKIAGTVVIKEPVAAGTAPAAPGQLPYQT